MDKIVATLRDLLFSQFATRGGIGSPNQKRPNNEID